MTTTSTTEQERIYDEQADGYDALIAAEDADRTLQKALLERFDFSGEVADIGAGTGRLSRWVVSRAKRLHLVDRASAMLEVAKRHLGDHDHVSFTTADARELPLDDNAFDLVMAGWVFGHFRHWMPEGWQAGVDQALAEMTRIARPGSPLIVIETLGTGHEAPRKHEGLDEYFAHLEASGFERRWHRTDYQFGSVDEACDTLGGFFGEALVEKIRAHQWARVPECTAVFTRIC